MLSCHRSPISSAELLIEPSDQPDTPVRSSLAPRRPNARAIERRDRSTKDDAPLRRPETYGLREPHLGP